MTIPSKFRVTLLGVLILVVTLLFWNPALFGICFHNEITGYCESPYRLYAGQFLPFVVAFIILSRIVSYLSDQSFRAWLLFTVVYGFLYVAWRLVSPDFFASLLFIVDYEVIAWFFAFLYFALTLILFLVIDRFKGTA